MSGAYENDTDQSRPDQEGVDETMQFIITFVAAFLIYLILSFGSGDFPALWSLEEVVAGVILSVVAAFFGKRFLFHGVADTRLLQPNRWVSFLMYIGPFFIAMAKANVDVAYRVITGKINPGIVRISPNLKTNIGVTMLANSITLTPGTLTVDVDEKTNDLFIHWINVDEAVVHEDVCDIEPVCGTFPKWARRVTE